MLRRYESARDWIALHLQDKSDAQLLVNDAVILTADIWRRNKEQVVAEIRGIIRANGETR